MFLGKRKEGDVSRGVGNNLLINTNIKPRSTSKAYNIVDYWNVALGNKFIP